MGPRYYVIAAWLSSFKRKDSIAAGTVVAVGKSVSDLREGDRVAWCSILSKEV
jgi:threonine dehydrogenase-like Zn-dependent dehydrogenase